MIQPGVAVCKTSEYPQRATSWIAGWSAHRTTVSRSKDPAFGVDLAVTERIQVGLPGITEPGWIASTNALVDAGPNSAKWQECCAILSRMPT
jgi:hypothetical protein